MEGAVDKLALSGGDIEIALRRPVFQRVGVFTYNPFAGAGGVKQDGIEGFGQGRAKNPAVEVGQSDVADAAAADVGMQHLHPAGGEFIGENAARVAIRAAIWVVFDPGAAATSITRSGCRLSANRAATGSIELAS